MVPAPDTYNGNPSNLHSWLFGLELYFSACHLDKYGGDMAYCCALMASLLYGSALAWYCISYQRSPTAILRTWAEIRAALEKQFGVIQETRNARDKLHTLV